MQITDEKNILSFGGDPIRDTDSASLFHLWSGCSGPVGRECRTRNREVVDSTHTQSTASNLEQVANLLCAQANSASYPQRDGK